MSGGGFFSGAKFRYSGRTEREILSENLHSLRALVNGTSPSKRKANSVPATPSSPQGDLAEIRYSSLPRSTMSEPLGGCTDQLSANVYCPENSMPLLETVSEEARRHNGESNDHLSDYYFRDSFDHSSSESGFVTNVHDNNHRHRHNTTSNMTDGIQLKYQNQLSNNAMNQQNATNSAKTIKKFSIIHAFIPSFIFVVIILAISAVFIFESDSDLFINIKNWPEMICLKYQYYQPLKDFISKKVDGVF